jgi:hypothetical protein
MAMSEMIEKNHPYLAEWHELNSKEVKIACLSASAA